MSDSSGNGTTLTDTNTVAFTTGKFFNGGDYESGNSEYQYAADSALLSQTGNVTLSAWIKPESVTASTLFDIVGKWDGSNESYLMAQFGDEIRLYVDSSSNYVTTNSADLSTATWYHITGVYDTVNATAKIYVNGSLQATTTTGTIPSSIGDDGGRFQIGAEDSTTTAANFYDGIIDDIRLYKKAFSSNEALQLYTFAPSPVAYWKLDDGSGTTTNDSSTNGNVSSAFTGNTTWAIGKYGSALNFDGTNDVARVVETTSTDLGASTHSYTVSAWIKTTTNFSVAPNIVAKNGGSSAFPYGLYLDTSENGCFTFSDGTNTPTACGSTALNDGNWHYLTGIRDVIADKLYMYVDGVLITSSTDSTTATTANNDDVAFGNAGSSYVAADFNGDIDDIKIYNYTRTSSQITEDMNAEHPIGGSPIASQVLYYRFDSQQGSTARNGNTAIPSLTGSISGATWKTQVNCQINGCLDFDGTDDVVTVTNATSIDLNDNLASGFTASAWVYADSDGEGDVGQIFQKGTNTYLRVDTQSGSNLDVEASLDLATSDATVNVSTPITISGWNHIAVSYTDDADDEITIWINGRSRGTSTNGSGAPATESSNLLIGGTTTANFDKQVA